MGLLEEQEDYVDGGGREVAQQMEYGSSLKGEYNAGFLSGFELNGYLADAGSDSDGVETGKLYGVQLLSELKLTETTHVKVGGGYEWLEWDDTSGKDQSWTFAAEGSQQLSDALSLTGHAKFGVSEAVYGGGVRFDLGDGSANTNRLAFNYSYIDGRDGIEDDQRFELGWTVGFGAGPASRVAAADLTDTSGAIRAAADVAVMSPANNLLNDVMKPPGFLPERVLARAKTGASDSCPYEMLYPFPGDGGRTNIYYYTGLTVLFYFQPKPGSSVTHPSPYDVFIGGLNPTQELVYEFPKYSVVTRRFVEAGVSFDPLPPLTLVIKDPRGTEICSFALDPLRV